MKENKTNITEPMFYVIFIVSIIFFFINQKFGLDGDLIWHYLLGKDIAYTHTVSTVNNYSWIPGTTWSQQEWLYDYLLYNVLDKFGMFGFYISYIILMISLFFTGYKNQAPKHLFLYIITGLFVFATIPTNAVNRPSDYSTLLIIIVLTKYDSKDKFNWLLSFLLGIFLSNFHCGQAISLIALLPIRFCIDVACKFIYENNKNFKYFVSKLLYIIAYFLGMTINVCGPSQTRNMFKFWACDSTKYLIEFKPLNMTNYFTIFTVLMLVITIGYTVKSKMDDEKAMTESILVLAFLVLTFTSAKSSIFLVYTCIIIYYKYFEEMFIEIFEFLTKKSLTINANLSSIFTGSVIGIILSFFIFMSQGTTFDDFVRYNASGSIDDEMIEYMKKSNMNIIHSYDISDYLMYNGIKTFVDTRQIPYIKENGITQSCDDAFALAYEVKSNDEVNTILCRYNYDAVLCDKVLNLNWYFENNPDYKIEYEDSHGNRLWTKN